MAQSLAHGLRPARRSGLTNPEPVRNPDGHDGHPTPDPAQDLWTSRRTVSGRENTPENPSWRQAAGNTALAIQPVYRG